MAKTATQGMFKGLARMSVGGAKYVANEGKGKSMAYGVAKKMSKR